MASRKPPPIGSHVPVARGLAAGALPYAERVGAEAIQVFLSNPRGWKLSPGDPAQDAAFREAIGRLRIPAFVHATYLVNFATPDPPTLERSVESVRHTLRRAALVGARGVVVHTGSAVRPERRTAALTQLRDAVLPLLDELPVRGPRLLFEPTAGGGAPLCSRVDDLPAYLAALDDHPRTGVCLDTCHAFAAGHDLAKPGGVRATLDALGRAVGHRRLHLVHANDAKDPAGSFRDRHENIGAGLIGSEPFAELLAHPAMRGVPVVVETPGRESGHARDIVHLKELRADG
ncbi:MAG: deoxyribonuclease IV [Streptosporangiales bacterium]